ncbi:Ig-like domain repeat protein [Ramlibacter humi]|uniref:Bacterial Ig-like domain-containing protein n=1 Tax=Ramlibacter humi TaxID=2530451 RepID=A0A4Z0BF64_9BURK|nr:Ig-like domain repeat protein [Ramlibacter humi]TFY97103.1 hypothetical protein EZ216_19785 [Ramlibacter humi]
MFDSAVPAIRRWGLSVVQALALFAICVGVVRAQTATSTTVFSNLNPSNFSQQVDWTATVTGSNPTGTVTFMDGSAVLAAVALTGSGNSRTAKFSSDSLPQGSHSITAAYSGDGANQASASAALAQTVNRIAATAILSASSGLTAAETYSCYRLSSFNGGGCGYNSCQLLADALLARFGGTPRICHGAAPQPMYLCDSTQACAAVLYNTTPATANITYPQGVTLTATVTNSVSPTGTVTFKDGTAVLASVPLSGGVASYAASLGAAVHALSAVYSGDASNQPHTGLLNLTVAPEPVTLAFSSGANPSTAGAALTLTATVTASTALTGTVTFKDGPAIVAVRPLVTGVAQAVAKLASGSHVLRAVYSGDGNHAGLASAPITQSVSAAVTSLTLTANPATGAVGQNISLSARVDDAYLPSGLVKFTDGERLLGTAPVVAGMATLSVNNFTVGTHGIDAAYAGDDNNAGSTASQATVVIADRAPMTWQYGYDEMGRTNTVVDPTGQATYFYYDGLGRRIQVQQPPDTGSGTPTVTRYGYDAVDALTSVADPRSLVTTYTRDGRGRSIAQSSPDSGGSTYTYNFNGNVLTSTDARGKTTSYTYDALQRVTSISYPSGVPTTFEYDRGPAALPGEIGQLTRMSDESGQTTYTYDAWSRLTGKAVTIGSTTFNVGYGFGNSGGALDKLTAISYPSGSRVNYLYDDQGSVTAITAAPAGSSRLPKTVNLLSQVTRNADLQVESWQWADGTARKITYDGAGNIDSYSLGDPARTGVIRQLQRDAAGRIVAYTHANGNGPVPGLEQSFAYDNLDRLIGATTATGNIAYTYDANGNRTSTVVGVTTYANTVERASNRLLQVQDAGGTSNVVHDAAGNVVADGVSTYTYSDRGRMATASKGGLRFTYNGFGQRAFKGGPSISTRPQDTYYVYDEAGRLLGEYDANGYPVYETIYLGNTPVGVIKQTGSVQGGDLAVSVYNVHADQIDTPRMITRQDQMIVWRWDTAEPFGASAPDQDPTGLGEFVFNQRFPGQVFDRETGLFQNWNREYDASLGRYRQVDPVGLKGGINPYVYAALAPVSAADPTGLIKWSGNMLSLGTPVLKSATIDNFYLTSACDRLGRRYYVQVRALAAGWGMGLNATASTNVEFEDGLEFADPGVFDGAPYAKFSTGWAAGWGYGYSRISIGLAHTDGWGSEVGIDTSFGVVGGTAYVVDKRYIQCTCPK